MITIRHEVAGVTQFVDALGSGRVVFTGDDSGLLGPAVSVDSLPFGYAARIRRVSYNAAGAAHAIDVRLRPPSGLPAQSLDEIQSVAAGNTIYIACDLPVPREGLSSYALVVTTTGKAGDGVLEVSYEIGREDRA